MLRAGSVELDLFDHEIREDSSQEVLDLLSCLHLHKVNLRTDLHDREHSRVHEEKESEKAIVVLEEEKSIHELCRCGWIIQHGTPQQGFRGS